MQVVRAAAAAGGAGLERRPRGEQLDRHLPVSAPLPGHRSRAAQAEQGLLLKQNVLLPLRF